MPAHEGEPLVFPMRGDDYVDTINDCRGAHLHILANAYRRYLADDGLGVEPPAVQEVLQVVMQNADPRIPELLDYLDAVIDFAPKRPPEEKGKKYFAWIPDKDLIACFWEAKGAALKRNKELKKDYNLLLRRAMELKGRKVATIQPTDKETGKQFKVVAFDRVAFKSGLVYE